MQSGKAQGLGGCHYNTRQIKKPRMGGLREHEAVQVGRQVQHKGAQRLYDWHPSGDGYASS